MLVVLVRTERPTQLPTLGLSHSKAQASTWSSPLLRCVLSRRNWLLFVRWFEWPAGGLPSDCSIGVASFGLRRVSGEVMEAIEGRIGTRLPKRKLFFAVCLFSTFASVPLSKFQVADGSRDS